MSMICQAVFMIFIELFWIMFSNLSFQSRQHIFFHGQFLCLAVNWTLPKAWLSPLAGFHLNCCRLCRHIIIFSTCLQQIDWSHNAHGRIIKNNEKQSQAMAFHRTWYWVGSWGKWRIIRKRLSGTNGGFS